MNINLFLSLVGILGATFIVIGVVISKKIKTSQDYFLAGKHLGFWTLCLTLIGTQLGGGVLLGTCEEAYNSGLYGIFYTLGICLGFGILASGFAGKLRGFNVATIAELLGKKYRSTFIRKLSSFISVMSLSGILIGLVVASRKFLVGIGIQNEWVLVAFWLILIIYTVIGGLKAVVIIDSLQVGVIFSVFIGVLGYIFFKNPEFFLAPKILLESTPSSKASVYISMLTMPMFFSLIEQDLAQRFFSARSKKTALAASAVAGILLLLFSLIPVAIGILAKNMNLDIPQGSSILITAVSLLTNDVVTAFVSCAVLAAIISTADSLLCAISSLLAQDFNFMPHKKQAKLSFSKIITFVIGITILTAGMFFNNILTVYIQSYTITVCTLFAPIIFCFFIENPSKCAAFSSIFTGFIAFIILSFFPTSFPKELIAVAASFGGYGSGFLIERFQRAHD